MDKFNDVEYRELPEDEECMVTAVKIGELLKEPVSTIRKWAEYHENNLYIKKIEGKFRYTLRSVDEFKFIQDCIRNKKMTHAQVKDHMKKHGTNYSQFDGGLLDPKDPMGFTALSASLALENKKQLLAFMNSFVEYQNENNQALIESIKKEVSTTVQETIEESLKEFKDELSVTKDLNEKLDRLRESMEHRKDESNKNKKIGFFSWIFKRKS